MHFINEANKSFKLLIYLLSISPLILVGQILGGNAVVVSGVGVVISGVVVVVVVVEVVEDAINK